MGCIWYIKIPQWEENGERKYADYPEFFFLSFSDQKLEGDKRTSAKKCFPESLRNGDLLNPFLFNCDVRQKAQPIPREKANTQKKRASQPVWTSQWEESPTSSILVSFQWGNVLSAKRTGRNIQLLQAVKKKSPMESLAHIKWSHRQVTEWLHKMSPSGDGSMRPQKEEKKKKRKKKNETKSCQCCSEKNRTEHLSYSQSLFFVFLFFERQL